MTATPTPLDRAVESPVVRAARAYGIARDARFDGFGDTWDDLDQETRDAEIEDMREALVAALDVDKIARVLADWFGPLDGAYTCDCDAERCPVLPCPTAVTVHEAAAAALIEHLTQTGATR